MVSIGDILIKLDEENIQYDFYGDRNSYIEGFSSLNNYKESTVTWCKNINYLKDVNIDSIKLIILPEKYQCKFKNYIVVNNPKRIFFFIIEAFFNV